jgi:protein-tyrosine kinase
MEMERIQAALQKVKEQRGSIWIVDQPQAAVVGQPVVAAEQPNESGWSRLARFELDANRLAKNRIVTTSRANKAHFAFDMLRTRVLQSLRQNKWTSVAITSPTAGCGKTVVSVNLAFSLSNQKDSRTVLVDLDLRRPQVAKTMGLRNPPSIEGFLKGQCEAPDVFLKLSDNFAVAAGSRPVSYSAELLQSPDTARSIRHLKQALSPDVIVYDLSPMLSSDDVTSFLPNVDCVIIVAGAGITTAKEIDLCGSYLSEKNNVLGVVMNKCEVFPEEYGY